MVEFRPAGTSLFLRLHHPQFIVPGLLAIGLSVLDFLCLGVAGWLGGKLVYGHRLGVNPPSA
ncbi:hypothetical protein RHOFW104T7_17570 [Rhodanobacter thiooxydans]|uniref:Uncharacterized protein n=1 Tax=Rhodanobacter thiooxydans TaxID=416169 RepID=A0A154QEB8_9GAMM|nr:hypothetical protein [Rhodanobacter thiooxydans]EIL99201.1 hypothetical protein UUA_09346 [Rhodanobacter thiooxydans LCS2]KZC22621.1 hypothetical protein RHOFW104T7_17570 [Rhodanobacter thiooxydans]MCW0203199.1 DUF2231 domain-containing protein [Rhodanobacter thiooxydans]